MLRNRIETIGVDYPSAIALWIDGDHHTISHNDIHNCPYSAIVLGGTGTVIEKNVLTDFMQKLNDGGAIYITFCRDIIVRGNVAVGRSGTRAHAYYMDDQAENCTVEGNLSLNTGWPVHNHMVKSGCIRNNVFIDEGNQLLTFPRSSNITFEKNILVARQITFTIQRPYSPAPAVDSVPESVRPFLNASGITIMRDNILHCPDGAFYKPMKEYEEGISVPLLERDGMVFADPGFTDASSGDYSFMAGSPAPPRGIVPIDIGDTGISGWRP